MRAFRLLIFALALLASFTQASADSESRGQYLRCVCLYSLAVLWECSADFWHSNLRRGIFRGASTCTGRGWYTAGVLQHRVYPHHHAYGVVCHSPTHYARCVSSFQPQLPITPSINSQHLLTFFIFSQPNQMGAPRLLRRVKRHNKFKHNRNQQEIPSVSHPVPPR